MAKLTIITPLHCDSEEKRGWFRECVESVRAQDFEDWRWIVIDDAGPVEPEQPDDPRIRLIRSRTRRGVARCRNLAARLSTTEAILPLDGDDLLAPGALSVLWSAWDPRLLVYGDVQYIENGEPGRVLRFPDYSFDALLRFGAGPVTALHSKECWRAAGGWKPRFHAGLEDVEYWIAAGAKGYCGLHLNVITLLYRKHPQSRTRKMRESGLQKRMEEEIRALHGDLYNGIRPRGCCGGERPRQTGHVLPSRPVPPGPKVKVRYLGRRLDPFYVRGRASGFHYAVQGPGVEFEILEPDLPSFLTLGRGKDFEVVSRCGRSCN